MSNELQVSSLMDDFLSTLERADSSILQSLVCGSLASYLCGDFTDDDFPQQLHELTFPLPAKVLPLKSGHALTHSNLRTTIVAQRVELSRTAAQLTPDELAYTKILDRVVTFISKIFQEKFIDPRALFLHEAFIYDGRMQLREAFQPRPRFAVERALSSPGDYLGSAEDGAAVRRGLKGKGKQKQKQAEGMSASQPAIAIVYQLYLESGSVINVADLWEAFWGIVKPAGSGGNDDGEDGEEGEEKPKETAM